MSQGTGQESAVSSRLANRRGGLAPQHHRVSVARPESCYEAIGLDTDAPYWGIAKLLFLCPSRGTWTRTHLAVFDTTVAVPERRADGGLLMEYGLLIYLSDEYDENDLLALEGLVSRLASERRWSKGAPSLVDEVDDSEDLADGDEPIRTVGVFLPLTDPNDASRTIDSLQYQEVELVVRKIAQYSKERSLALEVTIGDTYAGEITKGQLDRILASGLLEPWRDR